MTNINSSNIVLQNQQEEMAMPYGYIYLITNKINNKIYVGQTTRNINKRMWEHKNCGSETMTICRAIQKYGEENFTIREIDTAKSREELNDLETKWIKYYNSTDKNIGYNLICYGRNHKYSNDERLERADRLIKCTETNEIFISIKVAAESKQLSRASLWACLNKKKSYNTQGGFHWEYIDKNSIQKSEIIFDKIKSEVRKHGLFERKSFKKIKCIDDGIIWSSPRELASSLGIDKYTYLIKRIKKCKPFRGKIYQYVD